MLLHTDFADGYSAFLFPSDIVQQYLPMSSRARALQENLNRVYTLYLTFCRVEPQTWCSISRQESVRSKSATQPLHNLPDQELNEICCACIREEVPLYDLRTDPLPFAGTMSPNMPSTTTTLVLHTFSAFA